MSISSCIRHPNKHPSIKVWQWQIELCQGDHCAAVILSIIEELYNQTLKAMREREEIKKDLSIQGIAPCIRMSPLIYISARSFSKRTLGFFGKTAVGNAFKRLETLLIIDTYEYCEVFNEVDKKYDVYSEKISKRFSKKRFILFHPDRVNSWVDENYPTLSNEPFSTEKETYYAFPKASILSERQKRSLENDLISIQESARSEQSDADVPISDIEGLKADIDIDRSETDIGSEKQKRQQIEGIMSNAQKRTSMSEMGQSSIENRYIDKQRLLLKNKFKNKKGSAPQSFSDYVSKSMINPKSISQLPKSIKSVIALCQKNGLPLEKLIRNDDVRVIGEMLAVGATLDDFQVALDKAYKCKGNEIFGLYYVIAIIKKKLQSKKRQHIAQLKEKKYLRESTKQEEQERCKQIKIEKQRTIALENTKKQERKSKCNLHISEAFRKLSAQENWEITKKLLQVRSTRKDQGTKNKEVTHVNPS